MATSGTKQIQVTNWDTLIFQWEITGQDYGANTSSVRWAMYLKATSDGAIVSSSPKQWSVTVNGTKYSGTNTVGISANQTKMLASGTTKIQHNADGSKTFSYSFSQEFNIWFNSDLGTFSGSGSGTLSPIPRASQPSCVTWPEHTENVGDFGDTISIHMNRAASTFTHTVRYEFGTLSGVIATQVGTGTTWTIPLSFMELLPKDTQGSGRIYVDTYSDSTLVGTKYCGFTATVPASVKPSCNMALEDINNIDDKYGTPVQGLSNIRVTIAPTLAYKSPIKSYKISIDGRTFQASSATSGLLVNAGDSPVVVSVTDERGRTGSASYTMKVQKYTPPHVSNLAVHRCDSDGTENEQGSNIKATFSADVTALSSKNSAAYTLRYKKSTETQWTVLALTELANVYAVRDSSRIFAADSGSSYDVEVVAADAHSSTTRQTSASTAFTIMNWGADGRSMAIGKVSEKTGVLEIALDTEFIGKVSGAIFDAIYPVGSIYIAYNHTDPSTLFGGTWERMTDGFLWASRSTDIIGQIGGEKEHKLTIAEMPAHDHGGTYTNAGSARTHAWLPSDGTAMGFSAVSVGQGKAHNNMPPYIQVSMWRRTA